MVCVSASAARLSHDSRAFRAIEIYMRPVGFCAVSDKMKVEQMRPALSRTRRFLARLKPAAALLALPLVAATITVAPSATPAAHAQNEDIIRLIGPGIDTSYLDPDFVPNRVPQSVTGQNLGGLPNGVSVDRVEWITDRWVNLFIRSAAMPGKPVKVQVLLARDWHSQPNRTFPSLWALDGMRARADESGWTLSTNIASFYADKNVNVVMPVGGESSFYSDWQQPDNGIHYKWESFLMKELIPVLRQGWRTNDRRAVVGISMGATAAMNLAHRHPNNFDFVGSFSGYLDVSSHGMPEALGFAVSNGGKWDAERMWGPYGSQGWKDNDPKLHVSRLRNMAVYVSSGNGNAGPYDEVGDVPGMPRNFAAFGLEAMSRMTSQTFVDYAIEAGVSPIVAFRPSGTHDWPYWQFEMTQAFPYIANALGMSGGDRGANCIAGGAIGARIKYFPDLGSCVSGEYDGPRGGRIQDFRGGRAYWTPATDARFLWGRIGARYSEIGGPKSWMGYPTSEEYVISNGRGRFVTFENGNIYWTHETGAQTVSPLNMQKWGEKGWENGPLGYPIEGEQVNGDDGTQRFENGVIVRRGNQVQYVQGLIAKKYLELGGLGSRLGFPTTGEIPIPGGAFSAFEHGNIYWSPSTGAHVIYHGPIFDAWGKENWEQGRYGFPVADQAGVFLGGQEVRFQHGRIRERGGNIVE